MALQEDIQWLLSICQVPKDLNYLEPGAHAFSIFFALQGKELEKSEITKLSMLGIIATTARMNNAERFHQLDPYSFLQVANMLLDEDDNGDNYNKLITKIVPPVDINTELEDTSNG
jgi:hypothetical protein